MGNRLGFSEFFGSCYGWHAGLNFSRVINRDDDADIMGDWSYNDGQCGTSGQPINGDYCDSTLWYPTFAGLQLTIGAAVGGALPLTPAPTVTAGGANGPPSTTFSVRLTSAGNPGVNAVAAVTTNGSGVVTSAVMVAGGISYTNGAPAVFTPYDQPWDSTYALRRQDQIMGLPGWDQLNKARLAGKIRVIYMPDDHDHGGNNMDWSTATSPPGATTLAKVLDFWRSFKLGMRSVMAKYATNTWTTDTAGDVPTSLVGVTGSNATVASASDFDRIWFYRDKDATGKLCGGSSWQPVAVVGPEAGCGTPVIREIYLDCVRYKSAQAATDNASKTMLGAYQKAQVKALMLAAKSYKSIWMKSGKDVFNKDNGDGWWSTATPYFTELNEILAYIQTNNLPVLWMTGDRHCAHAGLGLVANGDAWDVFTLCPTPLGSLMGAPTSANESGNTPYAQMVWQNMQRCQVVYGRWIWDEVNQQTIMACYDMASDRELFAAGIPAYQRVPTATGGWMRAARQN